MEGVRRGERGGVGMNYTKNFPQTRRPWCWRCGRVAAGGACCVVCKKWVRGSTSSLEATVRRRAAPTACEVQCGGNGSPSSLQPRTRTRTHTHTTTTIATSRGNTNRAWVSHQLAVERPSGGARRPAGRCGGGLHERPHDARILNHHHRGGSSRLRLAERRDVREAAHRRVLRCVCLPQLPRRHTRCGLLLLLRRHPRLHVLASLSRAL